MPDEISIFAKLGSWLYGSLMHATGVLGRAFETEVVAVRVFEVSDTAHASFVDVARLGLSHRQEASIQGWATQESALFEQVRRMNMAQGVFRPAQLLPPGTKAFPIQTFYEGLGMGVAVSDCLCLRFVVEEPVWAVLALMRCRPGEAGFDEQHAQHLQNFKSSLAYMFRMACLRQGLIAAGTGQAVADGRSRLSTDQILSRLTPTECQLLRHLLLWHTERQIAQEIHRSQHTVHVHVKNIYRKLNVNSRKQLISLFNEPVGQ